MSEPFIIAVPHEKCILPENNRQIILAKLEPLIRSIKTHGLFQPAGAVRQGELYRLVWGVRRYYATKAAGHPALPVRVLPPETTPADELKYSIAENHCRQDESPDDTFRRVQHAADLLGCSFVKAAEAVQVKASYASKCQKIVNSLPDDAKQLAAEHRVGLSVLYEISKAKSEADKMELLLSYIDGSLGRDQIAKAVREAKRTKQTTRLDVNIDGAAFRLTVPASVDYEKLGSLLNKLRKELLSYKNRVPLKLLPQVLKEGTVS